MSVSPIKVEARTHVIDFLLASYVPEDETDLWAVIHDNAPITEQAAAALERLVGAAASFWLYLDDYCRTWGPPWRRKLGRFWRKLTGKR